MQLTQKAKGRVALALIAVLVGIAGEMDYQDAVKTEQATKEMKAAREAQWTMYRISR